MIARWVFVSLAAWALSSCEQQRADSERPVIIAADVDTTFPLSRIEYTLDSHTRFTIDYKDSDTDQARLCFVVSGRPVCRDGDLPRQAMLRPLGIVDRDSGSFLIRFSLLDGDEVSVWLMEGKIALTDEERICLVRGLGVDCPNNE